MKFYTKEHKCLCGIDLHTKSMYICIISQHKKIIVHKNIKTCPEALSLLQTYDFSFTPLDEKSKSEPGLRFLKNVCEKIPFLHKRTFFLLAPTYRGLFRTNMC